MADETATETSGSVETAPEATPPGTPKETGTREGKAKLATFPEFEQKPVIQGSGNMNLLLDVPLKISVQLGSTKMLIKDLLRLGQGSIVELEKSAGDPMDILIGEKLIARGEVVVVNDMFGVRLTDIISPTERIETLKQ